MKKSIGYNVNWKPEKECDDKKCPYHSNLSVRGRVFVGKVIGDAMKGTVKVMWERLVRVKKYNRYLKKKSVVLAHNPSCINAKKGDKVVIGETRPLSKRKHFVVLKVEEVKRGE